MEVSRVHRFCLLQAETIALSPEPEQEIHDPTKYLFWWCHLKKTTVHRDYPHTVTHKAGQENFSRDLFWVRQFQLPICAIAGMKFVIAFKYPSTLLKI
jgi:hypothetical protein